MKRAGRALGVCLLFCVAGTIGGLVGRGDAPAIFRRCQKALFVLAGQTEPMQRPMATPVETDEPEPVQSAARDSEFRGSLARSADAGPVRMASATSDVMPLLSSAIGYPDSPAITQFSESPVSGTTLIWDVTNIKQPIRTFGKNLVATTNPAGQNLFARLPPDTAGPFAANAAVVLPKGGSWVVYAGTAADPVPAKTVQITAPTGSLNGRVPTITFVKSGKYATQQKASGFATTAQRLQTYGGYLELTVESADWTAAFLSYVLADGNGILQNPQSIGAVPPGQKAGAFTAAISGLPPSGNFTLYVLLTVGDDHVYSGNSIQIAANAGGLPPNPPTITQVDGNAASPGDDGKITVGKKKFSITGTPNPDSDTQVLVFADDSDNPINTPAENTSDNTAGTYTAKVPLKKAGDFPLKVAFTRGSMIGPRSDAVNVSVSTQGPRVTGLVPPDFGTNPNSLTLQIQFSPQNQLNQDSAEDKSNYAVSLSNGTGKFGQGRDTPVNVLGAKFDPQANAVTLSFDKSQITPDVYQLVIRGRPATSSPAGAASGAQASGMGTAAASQPTGGTSTSSSQPAAATAATAGIRDIYGNFLEGVEGKPGSDFTRVLANGSGAADGSGKSNFVIYPEYTKPRPDNPGFNPSDRVDTRVARLYYYRDAHRVAQIINRDIKSMNKAAADMAQQLADKARQAADQATDDRRAAERVAVLAAQDARAAEKQLQAALANQAAAQQRQQNSQQSVGNSQAQLAALNAQQSGPNAPLANSTAAAQLQTSINAASDQVSSAQSLAASANNDVAAAQQTVAAAQSAVQSARAKEVKTNEDAQVKTAAEDRAKEDQFRREVAAAHEDPDTFAPGKPESEDPVQQVSVSVIGEGLIQLRGPMKGINIVRLMISEIDAPVGQVNVAVHTVQVNGEHGDRMEKVLGKIEKYIDHSRFLTAQSAQMLRNAVVTVASQKAEMAMRTFPDGVQEGRDEKYLHAFFGKDFIDELRALDSEFLRTGNKLLTLHSMDSTSLSSALFLLALAKNSVRQEILALFGEMMQADLPRTECAYFQAGGGKKAYGCKKFYLFSANAKFTSLMGQFNNNVYNDDTLTPLQREFIRLAQIFKSRLVTEMELNDRVMERSLIEQRIKPGTTDSEIARESIQIANKNVDIATQQKTEALQNIRSTDAVRKSIDQIANAVDQLFPQESSLQSNQANNGPPLLGSDNAFTGSIGPFRFSSKVLPFWIDKCQADRNCWRISLTDPTLAKSPSPDAVETWKAAFYDEFSNRRNQWGILSVIPFVEDESKATVRGTRALMEPLLKRVDSSASDAAFQLMNIYALSVSAASIDTSRNAARRYLTGLISRVNGILTEIASPTFNPQRNYNNWVKIRNDIRNYASNSAAFVALNDAIEQIDMAWTQWLAADAALKKHQQAAASANKDLVPLDQKKFLDMLIDETQDKYIELLEGTRAHTANIDNYIKRLTTALDDDLNTQFYFPAFREVRQSSRMWDVEMAQIETTSILTNNRAFGKVSPQATMEFDLPKRDILIKEAFAGTKALFDDYGALLQDPTFLALSKLNSGTPTSSTTQGAGTSSPVRNVIPGLSSQSDEKLLGQSGPGSKQFGSALEGLIPDPAIYKFETGTGYEIRPVVQPDGQAVTFHFNYMYTTNVREPVRADEKHLGRVKRHFIDTDVQLSNFELRKVSRYLVALKASRTARGVPLLEDMPGLGALFRPLPSAESSLQQNLILAQATIFPTLFDLMGLRWAPAIAELDALRLANDDFIVRGRRRELGNRVFDISSSKVDGFLGIPEGERRADLYHSQETIRNEHPNGYRGPGLNLRDSQMREGYNPEQAFPNSKGIDGDDPNGPHRQKTGPQINPQESFEEVPGPLDQTGAARARRSHNLPAGFVPPTPQPRRPSPASSKNSAPSGKVSIRSKAAVAPPLQSCAPVPYGKQRRSNSQIAAEPRRLAPRTADGKMKPVDDARPPRLAQRPGDVTPAQYVVPESRPQATPNPTTKKPGFFSWLRKSEKE